MKRICLLLTILVLPFVFFGQYDKEIKDLDKYFEQAIKDWNIPGMGVAIVKDGEVLLSKGYGIKNVDTGESADSETLFAIASNTKAFTSAGLAMLVDEGKINWDDKVVDYLPYFELYDPYVTANFTIRDLLCHRSGLATFSGDLIWYGSKYNRKEIIERAKYLEPVYGFRENYGYQNIMFVAAGAVIEEVTGQLWDDFIQENILDPLEMTHTLTTIRDIDSNTNTSWPHNERDGKNHTIDWVNWDNMAPAGSLLSCPDDIAKWMILQLNKGKNGKDMLWSESRTNEMWTIQTPKNISNWKRQNFPTYDLNGYGLGWDIFSFRGMKIVNHGGGYDGMISQTVLIPEKGFGAVFMTNNINWLPSALMYQVIDDFFTEEDSDWSQFYLDTKKMVDQMDQSAEEELINARIEGTSPSLSLSSYAGTYSGAMYGDCMVRVEGDHLVFEFEPTPLFKGTFDHWHYDTFRLNWTTDMMLPSGTVQFILSPNGEVEEMKIDVPNPDFDFTELEFMKVE